MDSIVRTPCGVPGGLCAGEALCVHDNFGSSLYIQCCAVHIDVGVILKCCVPSCVRGLG